MTEDAQKNDQRKGSVEVLKIHGALIVIGF